MILVESDFLIITASERAAIAATVAYASQREHWLDVTGWKPGDPEPERIPGNNAHHVVRLGSCRCVFSYTLNHEGLFRHLSLSVGNAPGLLPPDIAFLIADAFGFTGYDKRHPSALPDGWAAAPYNDRIVVVVQRLGSGEPS